MGGGLFITGFKRVSEHVSNFSILSVISCWEELT
jgi:hypothetical protein